MEDTQGLKLQSVYLFRLCEKAVAHSSFCSAIITTKLACSSFEKSAEKVRAMRKHQETGRLHAIVSGLAKHDHGILPSA